MGKMNMTEWWKNLTVKHPWRIIAVALAVITASAWYGAGLFNDIKASDSFTANGTESIRAKDNIEKAFGASPSTEIIVFKRLDNSLGAADGETYQAEANRLLAPLSSQVDSITTYTSSSSPAFISKDKTMTFASIVGKGSDKEIYKVLSDFIGKADQSKLSLSLGGNAATLQQSNSQVNEDLARAEAITFPVLLVLLLLFFGGAVAAIVPLAIGVITIAGAFALSRLLAHFVSIDSYAVNVITILGIGLSIDYALLSVTRFREELSKGSTARAVRIVIDTSGRTIFFSGITVIACIASLLVFPLDFLHSVAIGGASAIVIAMLFTVLVLPAVLMLLGKKIDAWRLPFIKNKRKEPRLWKRIADFATSHAALTITAALAVIGLSLIPLGQLKLASTMNDYHYLPSGATSRQVGQIIAEDFDVESPNITAVLTGLSNLSVSGRLQLACDIAGKIQALPNVTSVVSSASMVSSGLSCGQLRSAYAAGILPDQAKAVVDNNMVNSALRFNVITNSSIGSGQSEQVLLAVRKLAPGAGEWAVGGLEGYAYDTGLAYAEGIPRAIAIIIGSMIVLLTILLASFVIPVQAVIANALSLGISFAVLVCIFQFGWFKNLTGWATVDGIVMTPLVLIAAIAFGLAMDYSVFLYSRMFEVHQKTDNTLVAIRQGIIKTGPIITAAAAMVFVVVIAFAFSSVVIMQMIGIGLGVAVLVDAFFVRLLLVPSIMALMGKISWYAPRWVKRFQVRHE